MAKEVIGRGWLTVAAIKDGKDGATGGKGDKGDKGAKGDDAGVMTFSPATLGCLLCARQMAVMLPQWAMLPRCRLG